MAIGVATGGTALGACTTTVEAGTIAGQTWTAAGSPYCITGNLQASLLTIEPGVTVLAAAGVQIEVLSTISAIGTLDQPIVFSTIDPAASWSGFLFQFTPAGSAFSHCIIERASNSALRIDHGGEVSISNCTFRKNTRIGNGGAIVATGGSSLTISESSFEENAANPQQGSSGDYCGGAIYMQDGALTMTASRFAYNAANAHCTNFYCVATARGGAICLGASLTQASISNTEFLSNTADSYQSDAFGSGSAHSYGGAVYVGGGNVTLTNDIFAYDQTTAAASSGIAARGGGIYVNDGSVSVVNSTIAYSSNATGAYQQGGTLDIQNSVLYFNNSNGAQVGGAPTIEYSNIQNGYTGTGNSGANPVFSSPTFLHVVLGSPAIDHGSPDAPFEDTCFPPSSGAVRNDMGADGGPGACAWLQTTRVFEDGFDSGNTLSWAISVP